MNHRALSRLQNRALRSRVADDHDAVEIDLAVKRMPRRSVPGAELPEVLQVHDGSDLMAVWRDLARLEARIDKIVDGLEKDDDYERRTVNTSFAELTSIVMDAIRARVENGQRVAGLPDTFE